ncbi:MAG: hypothetical protein NVSMB19_23860 [Vulcanimicrobiaceae bacterium]
MIDTIFVPRGSEERAVRKAVARAGSHVRIVITGIGPLAGERAAREALAGPTLDAALVTGLCGVLSPAFAVGDTLVYSELAHAHEPPVVLDPALAQSVSERLPDALTGIRAIASERVVTTAREKLQLGERYRAQAVDMESRAIVQRLSERRIGVCVARVASDGVFDDLPELDRALDGSGGIDGFALALAMLRRPLAGARLARNGSRALAALERTVFAIVSGSSDQPRRQGRRRSDA